MTKISKKHDYIINMRDHEGKYISSTMYLIYNTAWINGPHPYYNHNFNNLKDLLNEIYNFLGSKAKELHAVSVFDSTTSTQMNYIVRNGKLVKPKAA